MTVSDMRWNEMKLNEMECNTKQETETRKQKNRKQKTGNRRQKTGNSILNEQYAFITLKGSSIKLKVSQRMPK